MNLIIMKLFFMPLQLGQGTFDLYLEYSNKCCAAGMKAHQHTTIKNLKRTDTQKIL